MSNDNTPSPKRRRPRKVKKPRVTPAMIKNMKLIARSQRRLLKTAVPSARVVLERSIAGLERWIKAYGG